MNQYLSFLKSLISEKEYLFYRNCSFFIILGKIPWDFILKLLYCPLLKFDEGNLFSCLLILIWFLLDIF